MLGAEVPTLIIYHKSACREKAIGEFGNENRLKNRLRREKTTRIQENKKTPESFPGGLRT
jgi:hypothetical protein